MGPPAQDDPMHMNNLVDPDLTVTASTPWGQHQLQPATRANTYDATHSTHTRTERPQYEHQYGQLPGPPRAPTRAETYDEAHRVYAPTHHPEYQHQDPQGGRSASNYPLQSRITSSGRTYDPTRESTSYQNQPTAERPRAFPAPAGGNTTALQSVPRGQYRPAGQGDQFAHGQALQPPAYDAVRHRTPGADQSYHFGTTSSTTAYPRPHQSAIGQFPPFSNTTPAVSGTRRARVEPMHGFVEASSEDRDWQNLLSYTPPPLPAPGGYTSGYIAPPGPAANSYQTPSEAMEVPARQQNMGYPSQPATQLQMQSNPTSGPERTCTWCDNGGLVKGRRNLPKDIRRVSEHEYACGVHWDKNLSESQKHIALVKYHPEELRNGFCDECGEDKSRKWTKLDPPSDGKQQICAICSKGQKKAGYRKNEKAKKKAKKNMGYPSQPATQLQMQREPTSGPIPTTCDVCGAVAQRKPLRQISETVHLCPRHWNSLPEARKYAALEKYYPKELEDGECASLTCDKRKARVWYELEPPQNGKKLCAICYSSKKEQKSRNQKRVEGRKS